MRSHAEGGVVEGGALKESMFQIRPRVPCGWRVAWREERTEVVGNQWKAWEERGVSGFLGHEGWVLGWEVVWEVVWKVF
jgi:hypothetical protein